MMKLLNVEDFEKLKEELFLDEYRLSIDMLWKMGIKKSFEGITDLVEKYNGYVVDKLVINNKEGIQIPSNMYFYFQLKSLDILSSKFYEREDGEVFYNITLNKYNLYTAVLNKKIPLRDYQLIKEYIHNTYKKNITYGFSLGRIVFDDMNNYYTFQKFLEKTYNIKTAPYVI